MTSDQESANLFSERSDNKYFVTTVQLHLMGKQPWTKILFMDTDI